MFAARVDPTEAVDAQIRSVIARMHQCAFSPEGLVAMKRLLGELDALFAKRHGGTCRYCKLAGRESNSGPQYSR